MAFHNNRDVNVGQRVNKERASVSEEPGVHVSDKLDV